MNARLAVCLFAVVALVGCGPTGPAIQEISPSKGEQNVAGDAAVRVVFNRDMDRASVESRFSIAPLIEGCDSISCPVVWSGRAMVLNHPVHQFAADTHYRVRLKAGYRDTAGMAEGTDHFWDFRTEAAPSIGAVTPADGSSGAGPDVDIAIQLSRNVLAPSPLELTLTGSGDPEPVPYRVGVSPDDPRRLVLSPLSLLRPRTAYTLHLGAGISDTHHNAIGTPRDVHFSTGPLDLTKSLAFIVRDRGASAGSRIALLRPPAGLNAPAPSLRVLFRSAQAIQGFGWSSDSTALYVLDAEGHVQVVPLDGSAAADSGFTAAAIAPNPARPELATVAGGTLHILRLGAPAADLTVNQAGHVFGVPAWSGDGRRLAVIGDDGRGGKVLRLVDRETLSVSDAPGVSLPSNGTPLSWSFDGTALAFLRATGEVWVYRPLAVQGDGLAKIGALEATTLAWSSDGGTVFAAGPLLPDHPSLVHRAPGQPVDGLATGFTPLAASRPGDTRPTAPSFDRRVAFLRPAGGVPQLWIMNNDGTGVTQLTFATYSADERLVTDGVDQPHWSPGNVP